MLTNKLENLKGPMLLLCLFTLAGLKERMGISPSVIINRIVLIGLRGFSSDNHVC
ncbi:hypothetical protein LguiB_002005 [Lonicera macranthoides]